MTATDKATEVVADVAEEVSDQALDFANAARQAPGRGLGLAVGAFFLGAGVGGGLAFFLTKRQLETKYSKIADDEIAEMRDHYQRKVIAAEAAAAKRPMEEIVKEQGYSSSESGSESPPMAVQPPTAVVEAEEAPTQPTVPPAATQPEVRNIFRERQREEEEARANMPEWNYQEELKRRSPDIPYVIHYDERDEMEGYEVMTVTYYEGDDILCDERDSVIDKAERERQIGERNLGRFGHGSNDPSVVYVRNDQLEIIYEVCKSPNSYAEEVHGFRHESFDRGNLERMRHRERYAEEE